MPTITDNGPVKEPCQLCDERGYTLTEVDLLEVLKKVRFGNPLLDFTSPDRFINIRIDDVE
jgi:hypothetical protein